MPAVNKAVEVLRQGGVILYPTETVWGIGCDATNDEAVARIFKIKGRPSAKAMISLVPDFESLGKWLRNLPSNAEDIVRNSSRPLTVVYDSPVGISSLLMAEDGSAAFRITSCNFAAEICRALGKPLVSSSANLTGDKPPVSFEDLNPDLKDQVDFICPPTGQSGEGTPSRILKITDEGVVTVIRD